MLKMMNLLGLRRQIGIASSPNSEKDDVLLALKLLISPASWFEGESQEQLQKAFQTLFPETVALGFETGRAALFCTLHELGISEGDEVILQAFTCVAVPDAIIWTGAKPVYVDVSEDFNMDPDQIAGKITKSTKAIIVQHTFGYPAKIDLIQKIATQHKLVLIEDCAHSLGGLYQGRMLGSFGDISFFSFGQEKVISAVRGGMVVVKDQELAEKLKSYQAELPYPRKIAVWRSLLHPILWSIINPTYYLLLGKGLLFMAYRFGLTTFLLTKGELAGIKPANFPAKLPNAQAKQALHQLKKAQKFNNRRSAIVNYYHQELTNVAGIKLPPLTNDPLLRFSILINNPGGLRQFAKKWHVILGNWYSDVIYPHGSDLATSGYRVGSCPEAESLTTQVVNLPTSPTLNEKDVKRVIKVVKEFSRYES